jgi:xylulokinase
MESIACLLRQYLECLGLPIDEVVSVGGGAKSKLWREIKADITGKRIVTLENKETGCLGTAIYAGVGAGIYESVEAASAGLLRVKDAIDPTAPRAEANAVYERYLALDDLLLHRKNL